MKLHALVNMAAGTLGPAFPGSVQELSVAVEDSPDANLLDRFMEICQFIGKGKCVSAIINE